MILDLEHPFNKPTKFGDGKLATSKIIPNTLNRSEASRVEILQRRLNDLNLEKTNLQDRLLNVERSIKNIQIELSH
jgi:hypothetical protein